VITLTKDAVTQYDIATNPQGATIYRTMDVREAEAHVRCALELGDTVREYDTTDRSGNPLRVVLHICAPADDDRDPDQGGVYEIPLPAVTPERQDPMMGIQTAEQAQEQQTGPIVWVLSTGEDHEGGTVLGVYASKDIAKGPFVDAATGIPFDLDGVWQDGDGAVHAYGGCDWVSLEPHPLIASQQLA